METEEKINKTINFGNTNYVKILMWISIPVFLIMISLLVFLWCNLDTNINDIKEQNKKNYENIASLKKAGSIEIEYTPLNKKQVIIQPKEIEKINNHIKDLTGEIQNEKNRTETLIDKDLSRLGTYMAVGIGFMTLLGVFVPIFINILSVQDLKDSLKDIEINVDEAIKNSSKLDIFSNKVNDIEVKTKNVTLALCNLVLQNAIARFFNVSSIVLINAVRKNDYNSFINLLEAIKKAFKGCEIDANHVILGNGQFLNTVEDFILFLETEKFRYQSVFSTKKEAKEFDNLIKYLTTLKDSSNDNESVNYKALDGQISVIINIFKIKHVKN